MNARHPFAVAPFVLTFVALAACGSNGERIYKPLGGGGVGGSSITSAGGGGAETSSGESSTVPVPDASTGRTQVLGEPCTDGKFCKEGLECLFPPFSTLGVPRCVASCSLADAGTAGSCTVGTCKAIEGTQGGCFVECDPFTGSGCPTGLSCEPAITTKVVSPTTSYGRFTGQCVVPGTKGKGETCEGGDCAPGLGCGSISTAYDVTQMQCGLPCSNAHPCDTGFSCVSVGLSADADGDGKPDTDYGICQTSCADVGASCSDGTTVCVPSINTTGVGVCITPGTVPLGGSCTMNRACAAGLACDFSDSTCRTLCTNVGSACTDGTTSCVPVSNTVYGICR